MSETIRINLKTIGDGQSAYRDQPVTFGVPLKEGQLKKSNLSNISISDTEGNSYPHESACTATWKNDLEDVKWLLVDTRASLAKGEKEKILTFVINDENDTVAAPTVAVNEQNDSLVINTGVMRVRIRNGFPVHSHPYSPDFLTSCQIIADGEWREMLKGDHGIHLYMKDSNGIVYDSCTKGFPPRVRVEEQNSLRCCVKVEGLHHTLDGRTFCPYILRLHFYAGKADIKVFHTFIFDQNPEYVSLSAVGIRIPVDLGDRIRGGFSGSEQSHLADDWREMRFTQTGHDSYTVDRNGAEFASGKRSLCRAAMLGNMGSLAAIFRDGWQEYPFGFTLRPGVMDVEVWPEKSEKLLEFTTPYHEPAIFEFHFDPKKVVPGEEEEFVRIINERPTAPISVKHINPRSHEKVAWVEEMLEKHAKGRVIGLNDMGYDNGAGAAKTSEIHLRFSAGTLAESELDELAASVQEPMVVLPKAAQVCASRVFGPFYHAGDPLFTRADAALNQITYEVSFEPDELCEYYGKMRYGNLPGAHSNPSHWVYCYYRKKDPLRAARYMGPFNNEANDEIFAFWGGYIRTGRRDYFLRAQKYSRCVSDVSTVHAHPEKPGNVGTMHGHGSHQWSGGSGSKSHTLVAGYLADYYFTGNRRLLDVAEMTADRIFNYCQERIGIIANGGGLLREYVGPISVLLDVYQATWKEKYFWLAKRSLDVLLQSRNDEKYMPNSIKTSGFLGNEIMVQPPGYPEVAWGNRYLVYESALRLMGKNPALKKLIIDEADYYTWECPVTIAYYEITVVCYAYELTGNLYYAAFAKWIVDEVLEDFMKQKEKEGAIAPADDRANGYIPKLMWLIKNAMTRDGDAFNRACLEWRENRDATPDRPEMERPDMIGPGGSAYKSLGHIMPDPERQM